MAVTEQVILDLSRAQAQIRDLDREFQTLAAPITVDVQLDADDDITRLRRDLSNVDATVDIDVTGLQAIDEAADDANRLEREFSQARAEADKVADQAERVKRELREADRASRGFGAGLKSAVVALGGFAALRGAFSFVAQGVQDFASTGESISRIGVLFGDLADNAIRFSESSTAGLALTQREALDAIATFGGLAQVVGLNQEAALEYGTTLTSLAVDLASFGDTTVETAIEAIGSALRGESEPIRQFNVLLNESAVSAKALELGLGGATGELDEAAKVQARYALILEQTGVAQGDFGRTIDSLGNQLKITRQEFLSFREDIGGAAAPALEAFLREAPALFGGFTEGLVNTVEILSTLITELVLVEDAALDAKDGTQQFFSGLQDGFQLADLNPFPDFRKTLRLLGEDFEFVTGVIEDYTNTALNVQPPPSAGLGRGGAVIDRIIENALAEAEALELQTLLTTGALGGLIEGYEQLARIGSAGIGDTGDAAERSAAQFLAFKDVLDGINQDRLDLGPLEADLDAVSQAIRDTFDPDSNGDVFASIDEFVEDLGRRFRESTEFEAGLAELTLRGFGALAEVIRTEGPKAADLLASSLADPAAAAEAEALLTDQANTLGSGYATGFALGIESGDAEVARALAATVESESVRAGILAAASDLALLFAANFDPKILIDNFDISLPASVIQANVGPGADLVGGSSSTDFGAQGSARGFTVNIVNPTVTDLDTSVGQATSTLGAISGLVQ